MNEISQLFELITLETLILSNNRISNLTGQICQLTALKSLNLSNNKIEFIPAELGSLKSLVSLDLSSNQIVNLPSSMGTLANLEELILSNNQITEIPDDFRFLPKIKSINLSNNRLISIPGSLLKETRVSAIDFSSNPLQEDQFRETEGYNEVFLTIFQMSNCCFYPWSIRKGGKGELISFWKRDFFYYFNKVKSIAALISSGLGPSCTKNFSFSFLVSLPIFAWSKDSSKTFILSSEFLNSVLSKFISLFKKIQKGCDPLNFTLSKPSSLSLVVNFECNCFPQYLQYFCST